MPMDTLAPSRAMRAARRSVYALWIGVAALALASCGGRTAVPSVGSSIPAASQVKSHFQDTYDFCAPPSCAADPNGPVVFDAAGAIYGTAYQGGGGQGSPCGIFGCGAVYKLTPSGSKYVETTPYAFCEQTACSDGSQPAGPLTLDSRGTIYGTAESGGSSNHGVVFALTPVASGYEERVLYSFCPGLAHGDDYCVDGQAPDAGVIVGKNGALYGTAYGGLNNCKHFGCGVVFRLTPSGTRYTESVVYAFCKRTDCNDGADPQSGLVADRSGVLYGVTSGGGAHDQGTVFSITPSKGTYAERVLYSFCESAHCSDGAAPNSRLAFGHGGALYGTTLYGGIADCNFGHVGCGTVFRLVPSGTAYSEQVLRAFCHHAYGCGDGDSPTGVVFGKDGMLYGAASYGGRYADQGTGCGVIFKLLPTQQHNKYRVLYYIGTNGVSDTCWPNSEPVFGNDGALYGTSIGLIGIRYGSTGTVWALQPSLDRGS